MSAEPLQCFERMQELARGLSQSTDIGQFLQAVLSAATELTGSELASLLEYDEAARDLRFTAVPWFHRDAIQGVNVPLEGSAAGWVFTQGKPLIIPDVDRDPRYFSAIDRSSNFKTRSLMGVPLFLGTDPVGVLEVLNKADGAHYTGEDVTLLETLASFASTALRKGFLEQRAQIFEAETAELDRLKSDFIAITSHELRTPLGLILGHATFLRELLGPEYHEQLDAIIRNAARLKEIIESLSSVDNYQTGMARLRQREVSIARIIEDVVMSFKVMASEKGVELKVEMKSPDKIIADADAAKVSVALNNLVKNALTFTNEKGHVWVKAARVPGFVKVSVVDDGVGIPAGDLPRVFERFFQVESHLTRRHGGMGLGLSVAKAMIELHGGRIWVESEEGKGSNFTFLLPVNSKQAGAAG